MTFQCAKFLKNQYVTYNIIVLLKSLGQLTVEFTVFMAYHVSGILTPLFFFTSEASDVAFKRKSPTSQIFPSNTERSNKSGLI